MQVLDDGRITDSKGKTINCKNTIIILTSNIGSDVLLETIKEDEEIDYETKEKINNLLKNFFKPEFLNRLDEIIFYKPLSKKNMVKILDIAIEELNKKLKPKEIICYFTEAAKEYVVNSSFKPSFGARPLRRFLQKKIETKIAEKILREDIKQQTKLKIDYINNTITINKT